MEQTRPSRKVLIIKTGYTETLTNEPYHEGECSLGDVLRTTALLHLYTKDFVVWLTDKQAIPLLVGNPHIREILEFNNTNLLRLMHEYYDIVINLEKSPGICALASSINAWQKYGFRFEPFTGSAEAYNGAVEALYVAVDARSKQNSDKHWLDHLYRMVGQQWINQGYILQEPIINKYEHSLIALNWRVGHKFNDKAWPMANWMDLRNRLSAEGYTIDLQPEHIELEDYVQWINAHTLIVSCDSLGIHLAMALGKRVVGLFGPTPAKEIQPYKQSMMLQADRMESISPARVHAAVLELMEHGLC